MTMPSIYTGFTDDLWIPRTKSSKAENVSIWWRHHDHLGTGSSQPIHLLLHGEPNACRILLLVLWAPRMSRWELSGSMPLKHITWASWRLESQAVRLFVHHIIHAKVNRPRKTKRSSVSLVLTVITSENVSVVWRHHQLSFTHHFNLAGRHKARVYLVETDQTRSGM